MPRNRDIKLVVDINPHSAAATKAILAWLERLGCSRAEFGPEREGVTARTTCDTITISSSSRRYHFVYFLQSTSSVFETTTALGCA
jgi:hypothetical protein